MAYALVDEGALDGNENERGGAHAHGDDVRGYDENTMTMSASNGLGCYGGARWFGPRRWNDAVGGGMVRPLGRRLLAYRHAQFEGILPDLTGCPEVEDINTLGLMFPQESGRNQEGQ